MKEEERRKEDGRRGGKSDKSVYVLQVQATLTHSVDKHGTLVWFLRLNFLFHHIRLDLIS